jgi:hypothetical protein
MDDIAGMILEKALAWDRAREVSEHARKPGEARIFASEALVPLLAAVLFRNVVGPLVVAVARDAAALAADIQCFIPGECFHLPGGGPGGDWLRPYDEAVGQRLKAARALSQGKVAVVGVEALVGGMPGELAEPPGNWMKPGPDPPIVSAARTLPQFGRTGPSGGSSPASPVNSTARASMSAGLTASTVAPAVLFEGRDGAASVPRSAAGNISTLSTGLEDRCETTLNSRSDSMRSPSSSILTGLSEVEGKMSSIPPRTANLPQPSTVYSRW